MYTLVTFQHGNEFRNQNGFEPPAQRGNIVSERTDQNYIVDWTHILSPTAVLDIRGSFSRFTQFFPDGSQSYGLTYDKLGIKNMPIPPTVNRKTAPVVRIDLYPDIIGTSYTWSTQNQWDFAPSLTHTHGQHTTHYGIEFAHIGRGNGGPGLATGRIDFNNRFWTQQYRDRGLGTGDGSGIAEVLLGLPVGGTIDYNDTFYRRNKYVAFFVQDDWKVNSKLTLNLGLRYDIQLPFTELHDRANAGFNFNVKNPLSDQIIANWRKLKSDYDKANPAAKYAYPDPPAEIRGGVEFAGANGNPRSPFNIDWTNVQPRLGFAWQIMPKTVVRGGAGIFHRWVNNTNLTTGYSQSTDYVRSLNGGITPSAALTGPYSLENPFPNGFAAPLGASGGYLTNIGRGVSFDNRDLKIPRTYEYSFGIEREFPFGMVLEASYVGSRTVHDTFNDVQLDTYRFQDFQMAQADPSFLNRSCPTRFLEFFRRTQPWAPVRR